MERMKRKEIIVVLEKFAKELSKDRERPSLCKITKFDDDNEDVCFSISGILEKESHKSPVVFATVVARFYIGGNLLLTFFNGIKSAKIVSNDDVDETLEMLFGRPFSYEKIDEDNVTVLFTFISMIKKIIENKYKN